MLREENTSTAMRHPIVTTTQVIAALIAARRLNTRLRAQMASMPAIEQAKGIMRAQQHISQDEAFDRLRSASQRSNTPVREIAKRIMEGEV